MLIQPGPLPPAPQVSVVITACNLAAYVGEAIESVLTQSLDNIEAIAVDDGSSDGTWEAICRDARPHSKIRAIRQRDNHGVSHARNTGLAAGDPRTPYVLFLDADDTLRPDGLETLVAALDAHPEAVAVWGRAEMMNADRGLYTGDWFFRPPPPEGLYDFEALNTDLGIFPPSVCLFRRWAAEAVGGFDYFQRDVEDVDFILRVGLLGPFVFRNSIVTDYRRHAENATNDAVRMSEGFKRLPRKADAYRQAQAYLAKYGRPIGFAP